MKVKDLLKILESADQEAEVKYLFSTCGAFVLLPVVVVTHRPEKNEILLSEDI